MAQVKVVRAFILVLPSKKVQECSETERIGLPACALVKISFSSSIRMYFIIHLLISRKETKGI